MDGRSPLDRFRVGFLGYKQSYSTNNFTSPVSRLRIIGSKRRPNPHVVPPQGRGLTPRSYLPGFHGISSLTIDDLSVDCLLFSSKPNPLILVFITLNLIIFLLRSLHQERPANGEKDHPGDAQPPRPIPQARIKGWLA